MIHDIILFATEAIQTAAENLPAATDAAHAAEGSNDVLGTLGINWKLLLAQLVNFSLVLLVFWKWIVKPLGKNLSDRQAKIEAGLNNAEQMEKDKQNFDSWRTAEMRKVREEAEDVMKIATDSANKTKQDLLLDAQKQSAKILDQAHAQIESEKNQMLREVRQEVATLVVSASEKILRSKLDGKKDQELISASVKDIR